jgi:hypothetical protein
MCARIPKGKKTISADAEAIAEAVQRPTMKLKEVMTAAFALSALFAASGKLHAEVNYPWCIIGDTRGLECVFSSREQCAQDGRNRGFGGQCIQNPAYKPGKPTVSQTARPLQTVRRGPLPTCHSAEIGVRSGRKPL